ARRRKQRSSPAAAVAVALAATMAAWSALASATSFVSAVPSRPGSRNSEHSTVALSAVKFVGKKVATYSEVDVDTFYKETISGAGGAPVGIERDLITKFFGDGDFAGQGNHEASLQ
ncbi:unnamed protein product, partial [Polarella glacialis]